jgi:hypothetical protein
MLKTSHKDEFTVTIQDMNDFQSNSFVRVLNDTSWTQPSPRLDWASDLESGKVLHFNALPFALSQQEQSFFRDDLLDPRHRNISLDALGQLKGLNQQLGSATQVSELILRFRACANELVHSAFPKYKEYLRVAPTSFRPKEVESRKQSVRADDKRLHVDAFPTRPNYGERILRVFLNINPNGKPRVWRIGEPFEDIAKRFMPEIKPYSRFRAQLLNQFKLTKSLRSEYDHLMLGLHDGMKRSNEYQTASPQLTYEFMPGSVWVCFSDQTSHAAMAGQFMMEQTYHLPAQAMYNPSSSPLAILTKLAQKELI